MRREQTLNQLLAEMDGFESNKGLVLSGGNEPSGDPGSGAVRDRDDLTDVSS